jgi:predicted PurR-regulated permease PerM
MIGRGIWQLILVVALGLLGIYVLKPLWLALLLSILLYLSLHPYTVRLQTRGWSSASAMLVAFVMPLLALGAITGYSLMELGNYLPRLYRDLEQLQNGLASMLFSVEQWLERFTPLDLKLSEYSRMVNLESWLNTDQLISSSGTVFTVFLNLLVTPFLAYFLIRDYQPIRDRLLSFLPNDRLELGWLLYRRISVRLQRYLRGLVYQAGILASVTATGFALVGFPSAVTLGLLTGIAGLVPYLGPFLALVAPAIVVLTTTGMDPVMLAWAALVILVGFGFDNLVVIPFLLAGTVNVHPALALVAVLAAGHVAGIPGMVLVIPLLGTMGIVIRTLFESQRGTQPDAMRGLLEERHAG